MRYLRILLLFVLCTLLTVACEDDTANTTSDTASLDTASGDSASTDSGGGDTSTEDTDSADTGAPDTGPTDTGQADTGSADTGTADTRSTDTGGDAGCDAVKVCGSACCTDTEVCGRNTQCCAFAELCGSNCCGNTEVCEGEVCKVNCGTNARCTDANGVDSCCLNGEICTSGQCFAPTTDCTDFVDCAADEYCETTLGKCLPQPTGEVCQEVPTGGTLAPALLWSWDGTGAVEPTFDQVMMTPMVADVNVDGTPDVIFISYTGGTYGSNGILRVLDGETGNSVLDITDAAYRTVPGGQVAVGDIDNDGFVEMVACHSNNSDMIAFNHDGSFLWQTSDANIKCSQAAPAIADLDADGNPEVFVRFSVVNGIDGSLKWHKDCVGDGGWATDSHNPCDYNTAYDLDGDGTLEVVGGNAAFNHDGSVFFDRSADFNAGYPSIGDLDLDGNPDIVVVQSAFYPNPYRGEHWLRALNFNGTDLWGPIDINQVALDANNVPATDVSNDTMGGGGPATIANFDSDANPEIALAGAYSYVVWEHDGTVKWGAPSFDRSSRKTGSSVFDFNGDGVAEAVYNDHYWMRVYDGPSGDVLFCECNTSGTLWEYPVIVDVNADGAAEIIVSSNTLSSSTCPTDLTAGSGRDACVDARIAAGDINGFHGIRVFASPDTPWVGTRKIWNQHTYHVTNVGEDGSIPRVEVPNSGNPGLNNFRMNVQPGANNIADLTPTDLSVDIKECLGPDGRVTLNFRVVNQGWAASEAGVPITVYIELNGSFQKVGVVTTTQALLAGESEILTMAYDGANTLDTIRFRVVINDPNDSPSATFSECDDTNNSAEVTTTCIIN